MKVLIIKTSSMGDVIHTLPALSDAVNSIAGIRFDWVIEEAFQEIPKWHSSVDKVIPVAIRRWRKSPIDAWKSGEWQAFKQLLQQTDYDAVIDAQGLLKSAFLVARHAQGPKYGLDKQSAKEGLSSFFYNTPIAVAKQQHAVERVRQLFASALNYNLPDGIGDFAIAEHFDTVEQAPYLVFNHSTTRVDKHYPEDYWQHLIHLATGQGWQVKLPWGNESERARAERLVSGIEKAQVLDKMTLCRIAQVIANASGCISVDTGLSHLSAALDKPNVTLFGPTDPGLVGGYGQQQLALRAADFPEQNNTVEPAVFRPLLPEIVWDHFNGLLERPDVEKQ